MTALDDEESVVGVATARADANPLVPTFIGLGDISQRQDIEGRLQDPFLGEDVPTEGAACVICYNTGSSPAGVRKGRQGLTGFPSLFRR